ncbi:MAG: hypothetical protein ACOX0U_01010 [Oscillospiraceae bacterium]|jgi:hypothetical protein
MAKTVRYGKKLFSLILTLAMLLGMLPAFQIVAEAKTDSAASCENFFSMRRTKMEIRFSWVCTPLTH